MPNQQCQSNDVYMTVTILAQNLQKLELVCSASNSLHTQYHGSSQQNTAGKVKARVMSGMDKDGRKLSFEELQPDIQRLLDYASTMQGSNQSSWRAKLTSELNVRIKQLERERMGTAMGNVSHVASSQIMNIENMNQKIQK